MAILAHAPTGAERPPLPPRPQPHERDGRQPVPSDGRPHPQQRTTAADAMSGTTDVQTIDVPDVQTFGTVYRVNWQTDARGAVLVAYSRDTTTGTTTRTFIRFDQPAVDYLRHRIGEG
ncbi:hypothetical protein ACFWPU_44995 [Streptomyces sp. NPDC058471]|uniref:hypothetical protein n=1 Tax=Streptomyces sp. NPDC058471 TaxID=3346516 RepID=UPI0036699A4C